MFSLISLFFIERMVYYPDHGKSRVKITKADFNVLGKYEMLNDSAIDFYLKWIENEMLSPAVVDEFLFFGCDFNGRILISYFQEP